MKSVKRNLKGDAERWGSYLGRAGLGRDGMLLGGEGNSLRYTLTLALAAPHKPRCGQT